MTPDPAKEPRIESLDAAVLCALRNARDLGTWDTEWWEYAPPEWRARVRHAPRALVVDIARYLAALEPGPLEELTIFIERWMKRDPFFAAAIIAKADRSTPLMVAEAIARYENELRDGK